MSNSRKSALNNAGEGLKNPSQKFLSWKSESQNFQYYDKESKENVNVPLPLKFLTLKQLQSVKGWSDALNGQIISNEVEFLSTRELTPVCYHKNNKGDSVKTTIAKGYYKDIKEAITTAGGRYHKSIYVMLENGELANIQLKGASVKEWGDFFNKVKNRLTDELVVIDSFKSEKKGAVKYYVPEFKLLRSITEDESQKADEVFNTLDAYLTSYFSKDKLPLTPVAEEEPPIDDELDY